MRELEPSRATSFVLAPGTPGNCLCVTFPLCPNSVPAFCLWRSHRCGQRPSPWPRTAILLLRIKDFVERNLRDPGMNTAMVASGVRLSPRYINDIFKEDQTSLI